MRRNVVANSYGAPVISAYHFDYAWLGGKTLTPDVVIGVDGDTIASVVVDPSSEATRIGGVAMPGLVSAHSHAFHRSLRGRTHDDGGDFWAWRDPMYEIANSLDPDSYHALATSVFSEMVRAGITTVGEFHYVHHQPSGVPYADPNAMGHAILAAAAEAGIRLTLLDTLYLASDVNGAPPLNQQRRFSDGSAEAWATRVQALTSGPMTRIGVAAHSVRAVSASDLTTVAKLSESLDCPAHIHLSEQAAENEAAMAAHGVSPVILLSNHGMLSDRLTLVHATHVADDDRQVIANSGAMVCFCPTTEADLGDGIGPAFEYSESGVEICLGSDSNAVIDPFLEMRQLEHHDRLRLRRRGVHSPAELLRMGTSHGARSLGWNAGRLEPGMLADITVVSLDDSARNNGLGSLTMATTRHDVSHVFVGGRMVVS